MSERSKRGSVFLIAPNGVEHRDYVNRVGEGVLLELGFEPQRVFTKHPPDRVFTHILTRMAMAQFVVAVAIAKNENIFMEIGAALALNKRLYVVGRNKRSLRGHPSVEQIEDVDLSCPVESARALSDLIRRDFSI
jgi:hypothetical protein